MAAQPTVSVVIPCRDAAPWIAHQLEAVAGQTYSGDFEIIVADNGSTDGSADVARSFQGVRVIDASGRAAPNVARAAGSTAATGELLLFTDADDIVVAGWVDAMVRALAEFDLVTGPIDVDALNEPALRRFRHRREGRRFGFLPAAHGGNLGIRRDVLEALGGWDEALPYGPDDIEIAWRAQLAGFKLGFANEAVVQYRLRPTTTGARHQAFVHGENLPRLIDEFRDHGLTYRGFVLRGVQFVGFMTLTLPLVPFVRSVRQEWVRRAYVAGGFMRELVTRGRDA